MVSALPMPSQEKSDEYSQGSVCAVLANSTVAATSLKVLRIQADFLVMIVQASVLAEDAMRESTVCCLVGCLSLIPKNPTFIQLGYCYKVPLNIAD